MLISGELEGGTYQIQIQCCFRLNMGKDTFKKELDELMGKCNQDLALKQGQRQFIDPHLRELKKQDKKVYFYLVKKHNWKTFL